LDESTIGALNRVRRNLPWLVVLPAIIVAVLVSWGVRSVIVSGYGRMVLAGVSGLIAEAGPADSSVPEILASRDRIDRVVATRVQQGSLEALAVVDSDGSVLYESAPATVDRFAGGRFGTVSAGQTRAWLAHSNGEDRLFVAGPAMIGDGELTVYAIRPAQPVVASSRGAILAVLATILAGAGITYVLLRWGLGRAQHEIERSHRDLRSVERRLEDSLADLESHSVGTLLALTQAVDAKDSYTARHSLNVADYARTLAAALELEELAPVVERAGLLHDIGKIVLHAELRSHFDTIIERVRSDGSSFEEAEREVLGYNHADVGAVIARAWNLPVSLCEAIEFHHDPTRAEHCPRLCAQVHIANILCISLGIGLGNDGLRYAFHPKSLEATGLAISDLYPLTLKIHQQFAQAQALVGLLGD